MRLGDLDKLKKEIDGIEWFCIARGGKLVSGAPSVNKAYYKASDIYRVIDNAPTVKFSLMPADETKEDAYKRGYEKGKIAGILKANAKPQGECKGCEYLKDCETCEDKAKQYSLGFQDGYLLGGFQLTELRRWLTSQGYSEGTVDDKIENFRRFLERIRGEEK